MLCIYDRDSEEKREKADGAHSEIIGEDVTNRGQTIKCALEEIHQFHLN